MLTLLLQFFIPKNDKIILKISFILSSSLGFTFDSIKITSKTSKMSNQTSQHILNTSANLLGFCLFVITTIHFNKAGGNSLIDEFTSIIALFLTTSCFFSFISIKTKNEKKELQLENIADNLFLFSIIGILFIILFMIVEYSNF